MNRLDQLLEGGKRPHKFQPHHSDNQCHQCGHEAAKEIHLRGVPVMTIEEKPIASSRVRLKFKSIWQASAHGFAVKVKVANGKETVRSATCQQHNKRTSVFSGTNEHGWVFWCAGMKPKATATTDGLDPDETLGKPGHYFIAKAPN